ncbi:MAG: hypothetical protein ACKPCP_14800 [Sphaerospermopsis kisseleviana]
MLTINELDFPKKTEFWGQCMGIYEKPENRDKWARSWGDYEKAKGYGCGYVPKQLAVAPDGKFYRPTEKVDQNNRGRIWERCADLRIS